ncbi:MAG TPA: PrgI family protein [Vitreimonas sp.]|nr:PrgI family protein [Vitreimonas sp.]
MREHAIPQDVVGYRFHIIGNMTLKQFLEVGAGCVVGFMIHTTNLPNVIKWPFIGLAVAVGAMAAFVPFEERPLDHWIVTFFSVLYKPTKFFWRKDPKIPDPFLYKPQGETNNTVEIDLTPARRQRIKEYLGSLSVGYVDPDEAYERQRMAAILASFGEVIVTQVDSVQQAHRPSLVVRPHSLKEPEAQLDAVTTDATYTPVFTMEVAATHHVSEAVNKQVLETDQVAHNIEVPELQTVDVKKGIAEEEATQEGYVHTVGQAVYSTVTAPTQALNLNQTQAAAMNANLPFPLKPTEPNKLVGMVLSTKNDLINDAIVEIQDASGMVARAVKTNALGQFFITTPLANGTYSLVIDKDGWQFTPLQLVLSGNVVEPLEIRSLN